MLLLAVVYLLGMFDVPTLIPYVTALLVIAGDAVRTARGGRPLTTGLPPRTWWMRRHDGISIQSRS